MAKYKYIIGIDEVGRGALAGPVTVAAMALPKNLEFRISARGGSAFGGKNSGLRLRDSKKLTPRQREIWFNYVKKSALFYGIASVSPKVIDKINISQAANLAAARAFHKLTTRYSLNSKFCKVFLDGGLYLSVIHNSKFIIHNSIIRGDEKIPAISLASIVAKVSRDRLMKKLHKKYPRYDFIHNVGYGTKKHIKAVKKYGYSKIHRKSFKV